MGLSKKFQQLRRQQILRQNDRFWHLGFGGVLVSDVQIW